MEEDSVVQDLGRTDEPQVVVVQDLGKKLQQMVLVQEPMVVWCSGPNKGQDITVRLVRWVSNGLSANGSQEDEHPSWGEGETLAMLKVHSSQLRRCSKYFDTCLSERWRERSAGSSEAGFELCLEVNADVACYTDCFSRMYSPLRKDFRDVEYSLELLKVASQIEYHELMDYISLYLSAISWSDEDERRIREYASSPDFSRNHLEELVIRLGLDVGKEKQQKKVCKHTRDLTLWGITNALDCWASPSFRKFVEGLLEGDQVGTVNSTIVLAAKNRLIEFEHECQDVGRFLQVENFDKHVLGMCWILKLLLSAGVAEEFVRCLLSLRTVPLYLVDAAEIEEVEAWDEANAGGEFAKVVLQMYREVVAGRLLLRAAERLALLENWHVLLRSYLFDQRVEVDQVTKDLFLTLPLEDQVRLINIQEATYSSFKFIDPRSLATLVKKNCLVVDGNNLHVVEVNTRQEQVSSDNVGDEDSRSNANPKRRKQRRNRRGQ